MKKISLSKANGFDDIPVKSISIEICKPLPKDMSLGLDDFKKYYEDEAKKLSEVLLSSLPQGIIEPLLIELMKKRISLYSGVMR